MIVDNPTMKSEIKNLIEEIRQIREQYEAEVGTQKRRAWPRAIKERVLRLCDFTSTYKEAAELSGISVDSIYVWRAMARQSGFKQLSVVHKKPKSLTVTDTDLGRANLSGSVTVTVTTPKGFLIEGLPPDSVIQFLLQLGDL